MKNIVQFVGAAMLAACSLHAQVPQSASALNITGTAGAGYVKFGVAQSAAPAAPSAGFTEFADSSGRISWRRGSDGFIRTFDSTLTANRIYTLADATMTFAGSASVLTSGRVPFVTTGGLLADASTFTFNSGTGALSVTSLSLTTALSATSGGTGLTSGTSGGIPYFSSSTAISSSAALAANQIVVGGGAGTAPTTSGATVTNSSGAITFTGSTGNMTIVAGTGISRLLLLQSTTSGGTATTFLTGNADQSATFANSITVPVLLNLTNGAGTTAGGIAFASSAVLYNLSSGNLVFDTPGGGVNTSFWLYNNGTAIGRLGAFSGNMVIRNDTSGSVIVQTNAITAATFDGSQNAQFAGTLKTSGFARVISDVTNATATMSNLTNLSVTVASGTKYVGTIQIFANDSTGADGLAFDLGGGGATFTDLEFGFAAQPTGSTLGTVTSTTSTTAITLTVVSTSDAVYTVSFGFTCNAGGTFIPRYAQNSHSTGTATVRKNSGVITLASSN